MTGFLVSGDIVLTMDGNRRVLSDSGVYIEASKIVDIGPIDQLRRRHNPERTIGGPKRLVMPGFVNAHDHYAVGLLRQIGDDRNLFGIIEQVWNLQLIKTLNVNDVYMSAKMGMVEQIRSGITTSFDDTVTWLPSAVNKEQVVEKISQAAAEVGGIRVIDTVGGFDLEEGMGTGAELYLTDPDEIGKICTRLIRRHNISDSTFRIWTTASWPLSCTRKNFRVMKEIADEYGTFTFSHVAEVKSEVEEIKRSTGKSEIEYLEDLGFLDKNVLFAHVVWVSDSDIKRISRTGTKVSHQPVCNQYLSDGIAPVPAMIREGVTVGLGIDDGGHMNEDFFGLMKTFCILHKGVTQDPSSTTAEKALEMATVDGAKALGVSDDIGSLEVGKRADIIVIDLRGWNYAPRTRPITSLVYGGIPTDVESTIVNGKILMENRKLTFVENEEELMDQIDKAAYDLIERADLKHLLTESHLGWKIPARKR